MATNKELESTVPHRLSEQSTNGNGHEHLKSAADLVNESRDTHPLSPQGRELIGHLLDPENNMSPGERNKRAEELWGIYHIHSNGIGRQKEVLRNGEAPSNSFS